jgi:glutamate carboxypeptidase
MAPTEGNHRLLAALDRASRDLGLGGVKANDPGLRGAGDISFVAPMLDGLDGLGARGEGAHAPEGWVDLSSLAPQIRRAALLIYRLTRP